MSVRSTWVTKPDGKIELVHFGDDSVAGVIIGRHSRGWREEPNGDLIRHLDEQQRLIPEAGLGETEPHTLYIERVADSGNAYEQTGWSADGTQISHQAVTSNEPGTYQIQSSQFGNDGTPLIRVVCDISDGALTQTNIQGEEVGPAQFIAVDPGMSAQELLEQQLFG